MPAKQIYFPEYGLMYTHVSGLLTGRMLSQHVDETDEAIREKGTLKLLTDIRSITSLEDIADANIIGAGRKELDNKESETAVVIDKDRKELFNLTRAYQICSGDHRKKMSLCYSLKEAAMVLLEDEEQVDALIEKIAALTSP